MHHSTRLDLLCPFLWLIFANSRPFGVDRVFKISAKLKSPTKVTGTLGWCIGVWCSFCFVMALRRDASVGCLVVGMVS